MEKITLLNPGPVNVSDKVKNSQLLGDLCHREPEFSNLMGAIRKKLLKAFNFGAPPHGGCAPGIDRIVMLIAGEPNIREIIPFPFNQKAEDLMMNAPAEVDDERLKELSLKILDLKKKD